MTQLTVSVVYVFPTMLVQMHRQLFQRASKNGRKQVMSAQAHSEEHQLSEEKMTNFLKTRRSGNDISTRLQKQAADRATVSDNERRSLFY